LPVCGFVFPNKLVTIHRLLYIVSTQDIPSRTPILIEISFTKTILLDGFGVVLAERSGWKDMLYLVPYDVLTLLPVKTQLSHVGVIDMND